MNWINFSTTLTIAAAMLLLVQGVSILRGKNTTEPIRILGFLTILLAVLAIMVEVLDHFADVAVSFELLTILVQGAGIEILFVILLLFLSVFLSFGWHLLRLKAGQEPHNKWSFLGALFFWLVAIISKTRVNPGDFDAPPVYAHKIWLFLVILYFCMVLFTLISDKWIKKNWKNEVRFLRHKTIERVSQYRLMPEIFVIIGLGLCLMIYDFALPGPALGLIIILLGWMALTEIITDGALHSVFQAVRNGGGIPANNFLFPRRKKEKPNAENDPSQGSKESGWSTVFKLVLVFVLLVFFSEALNIGKTIIQAFQAIGLDENTTLADSINGRLINALAQLNEQLQPETILLSPGDINFIRTGAANSTMDAIVANNPSIDVGSIKIPLNILISPIQGIARPIFKVRVVNGSIFSEGEQYILLASASDGRTWAVRAPDDSLDKAIPGLAEKMAFEILTSEPGLGGYGITSKWEAFQEFQEGMTYIQQYEDQNDFDALGMSIQKFQAAIDQDHNFALAYYRLGLALQQNLQPRQAKEAFEMGISLNPDSVPLKNALAYHLYFFDTYAPYYPAVVSPPQASDKAQQNRSYQARNLWHQIISLPARQVAPADLASAYSGLCRAISVTANSTNLKLLAYFYCYRSQRLLERIPSDLQSQEIIHQAKAENLNNLGIIVTTHLFAKPLANWKCMSFEFSPTLHHLDRSFRSGYDPIALRYFEKASELLPEDPVIQCNAAALEPKRMKDLEKRAPAHYNLALEYFQKARVQSSDPNSALAYYQEAFKEYQAAIAIEPTYHEALNGYAYAYYVFRLQFAEQDPARYDLGIPNVTSKAENYARQALHLAKLEHDNTSEIYYASTLAEVLLTYGETEKAQEASRTLLPLFENHKVPDNYTFDEVRWDLAQALLCSIETDEIGNPVNKDAMETEADEYLSKIRTNERSLEIRLFSQLGKDWLNKSHRLPFCRS